MSIAVTPQLSYFLGLGAAASPTATASQSSITIMAQAKLPDAANPGGSVGMIAGHSLASVVSVVEDSEKQNAVRMTSHCTFRDLRQFPGVFPAIWTGSLTEVFDTVAGTYGFEAVLDGQTTPWQRLDPMKPTSGSLPVL